MLTCNYSKIGFSIYTKHEMMKIVLSLCCCIIAFQLAAQSPEDAPLPERFQNLDASLLVNHFPSPLYATTDPDSKFDYQWKHTTSVMSPAEDVQITSCGAYIFYNDQWNLRVEFDVKDFSKLFDCKKGYMKKGQPYTFKDNWRTQNSLSGGWAMWFFIGKTTTGKEVYGVGKLETIGELYPTEK